MKALAIVTVFLLLNSGINAGNGTIMSNLNISPVNGQKLTYLALGDSYTIGEAVDQQESFPCQLVDGLKSSGVAISDPRIIAKTGWTTDELQAAITEAHLKETFSLVTLLIGVNNQYRGYSEDVYRKEFKELLLSAIRFAGGDKRRVFVVSIPDWGVTPFAANSDKDRSVIGLEIDRFNQINKMETFELGVTYIDITAGSKLASSDATLIASDGLHPSGKMYKNWASALHTPVLKAIKSN